MACRIKIKLLRKSAKIPKYATPGSSACDIHADIDEPQTLHAGEIALIPTGIALDGASENVTILLFARSGLASKHGIALANGVGVIDSDYRGEIKIALINQSHTDYDITPGERIAQMMFVPILQADFEQVTELTSTERGEGGFGHSGS